MSEVHVWRVPLDVEDAVLDRLQRTLTEEERRRSYALREPLAARRRLAAKGTLRWVLASQLGVDPSELTFRHGLHGKPELDGHWDGLRFSTSHAGGEAVVAIAWRRAVGVDIERIEPRRARGPIADRLFSRGERAELRQLADGDRARRFYELWTRKEAYAKALGTGLTSALLGYDIRGGRTGWLLHGLPAGAGITGALCVEGSAAYVRSFDLSL